MEDPKQVTVGGDKPAPLTPAVFDAMFSVARSNKLKGSTPITTKRPAPRIRR